MPSRPSEPGPIRELAREHAARTRADRGTPGPLRKHLKALDTRLATIDGALRMGAAEHLRSSAREWFLDNHYLIQETVAQLRGDLSKAFIRDLPVLGPPALDPPADGVPIPRILELARHLVERERAHVDPDHARTFLRGYQRNCPLTMAELWAFPLILRVALLDELARQGARLTEAPAGSPLTGSSPTGPSPDDGSIEEHVAGAIRSLRAVSREDWNRFFEATSRVEGILRKGDPSGIHPRMDFQTRDRYRKAVEEMAAASGHSEEEVARRAVEAAAAAGRAESSSAHLGHLLAGPGREGFERELGCRIGWRVRAQRSLRSFALPVYTGSVALLGLAILALLIHPVLRAGDAHSLVVALALALGLVPAVKVAVTLVNRLVPRLLPPTILPKLSFEEGIPDEWRTVVVVPCLLTHPDEVDALLGRLETNHLGNRDRNLSFALLSDYADASSETVPGEEALLDRTRLGIRELNRRYGGPDGAPFLLLHRARRWNPAESRWMGWERKRGKLVEFNGLLLEENADPFPEREGDLGRLRGTRFVLTLDADTFLPQDAARRLVGTLAHPLNRPRFDERGRVVQGFTVLQPRVEVLPDEAPRTLFSRVFEVDRGVDLYSQVISDVHQDLFGEGIFIGKGLYDVAGFEKSLDGRVPDNALLSHDLFEGVHGRVGLVSDVALFEDFPNDLRVYLRRLHRWVRGDWQLLPWLLPRVPSRQGPRVPNRIDLRGRWRILDNLRRSLFFPSLLALLLAGWFMLPGSAGWWTGVVTLILGVPVLLGSGFVFRVRVGVSRRWAAVLDRSPLRGSGALRWILALSFLPHQARIEIDAVARTLYRLFVSRRGLLEWTTAAHAARQSREGGGGAARRWVEMAESPILALVTAGFFIATTGTIPIPVGLLVAAWFLSPLAAAWTASSPRPGGDERRLTDRENLLFRSIARRTWAFFEEFVGPDDHWLPPDHFQERPRGTAAHRTSPTNIGLTLVSALAARDLGYLTLPGLVATLSNTLDGMDRLERHRGHLLNWYDTRHLTALEPRYVSTVDSGNLAASLLVVATSCRELADEPVLRTREIDGLLDAIREMEAVLSEIPPEAFPAESRLLDRLREVEEALTTGHEDPRTRRAVRRSVVERFIPAMEEALGRMVGGEGMPLDPGILSRLRGWIIRIRRQAEALATSVDELVPWVPLLRGAPPIFIEENGDGDGDGGAEPREAFNDLRRALPTDLALSAIPDAVQEAWGHLDRLRSLVPSGGEAAGWIAEMEIALGASDAALRLLGELSLLERRAHEWIDQMDFRFLYDPGKRLFHVGLDVSTGRLDGSYYDLLASEARIASFIAMAKGEVSPKHWLQLGRPFGRTAAGGTLLSWSGTMFEYLMPPLFMRTPDASLLGVGCRAAIDRQIAYAERHRIPWGISESSYDHLDSGATYQYYAFGVPELAVRREVRDRIVVAPYASVLALPFRPRAVLENVRRLIDLGMFGPHGLYEAIDFGRAGGGRAGGAGQETGIVRSFMAHHQGMILVAVANHLTGSRMVERFHRDPRTSAASYLLYERAPVHVRVERRLPPVPDRAEVPGRPRAIESWSPAPDRARPAIHLLSNGSLSVLVTARGGGGIRWRERAMTRWRADPSPESWGSWIYLHDLDRNLLWASTPDPVPVVAEEEAVVFAPQRVEYRRRVQGIMSRTSVVVPGDANVEIRRLELTNMTGRPRRIRVAGYAEVALADPGEDRRHPAFQKLFVEAEYQADAGAAAGAGVLHFRRRRAAPEEPPQHLAHGLGATTANVRVVGWETDRERFLTRSGSTAFPGILRRRRDDTGPGPGRDPDASTEFRATLDPICSLILDVELPPGGDARITFLTSVGRSRDEALAAIDRFRAPGTAGWAEDRVRIGWEQALHALSFPPEEVRTTHELVAAAIVPYHDLRHVEPRVQPYRVHRRDALWGLGISGDLPVVLLRITNDQEEERLTEMLRYHALWRKIGVRVDLIVLDESAEGYNHTVRDGLLATLSRLGTDDLLHRSGGVHHIPASRLDPVHRAAVEAVARVRIDAAGGPASEQLVVLDRDPIRLPPFVPVPGRRSEREEIPPLRRPTDLLLDNGFGGFTPDGREYLIHLEPGEVTPAPWINVVATPEIGFTVSERGAGTTWAGNSAENRLTAWSNDPVLDRPGDALYLRDEETGEIWSPTPGPIPGPGAYQVRHGAGYSVFHHRSRGLDQRTELFAALDPAIRITTLRIENLENRPRRVTATFHAEWALGGSREREAPHLVTRFDPEHEILFAENRFAPASGPPIAFVAATDPLHGWTADRDEFLGRAGPGDPAGLHRIGLGQTAGGGIDSCGALQLHLDLEAGGTVSIHFLLGAAADEEEAVRRVRTLRDEGAIERRREAVDAFWEGLLSRTKVSTPDPGFDLLVNRWARYQALSCRIWGRSGLYQSAGAFGFRDQLQDVLAFLADSPRIARDHILEAARHQFVEGDVLHWWHPPEARGVRSRCSDDLLWLPFAVASYLGATGDRSILDERVPFLEGRPLEPTEQEYYGTFGTSEEVASLHEHCLRALRRGMTRGPNGLPLIGLSDWNDGMNRLGRQGRGESVWLAWFTIATARGYADICRERGEADRADELEAEARALAEAAELFGWDGEWYRRATHDDGTPVGSAGDPECRIDSIAQSWSLLSGGADPARARVALGSAVDELLDEEHGVALLLAPPFDRDPRWPGYIRAYPPGVRENGGQYTHAGAWLGWALAAIGDGDTAMRVFHALSPAHRSRTREDALHYRLEPYAVAGDIAGPPTHGGRGGWSWFTGSASWVHRLGVEGILGFRPERGGVRIDPSIPSDWPGFEVELRRGASLYRFQVENPERVGRGVVSVEVDGKPIETPELWIPLDDDGREHQVRVRMGRRAEPETGRRILP